MANGVNRRSSGDPLTQSLQQGFPLGEVSAGADDYLSDLISRLSGDDLPDDVIEGSVPWYMGGPFNFRVPGLSQALNRSGGWLDKLLAKLPRRPPQWEQPVKYPFPGRQGSGVPQPSHTVPNPDMPPRFDQRTRLWNEPRLKDPTESVQGGLPPGFSQQLVEEHLRRQMGRPTGNIITDRLKRANRASAGRGSTTARVSADVDRAAGKWPSGVGARNLPRNKYPLPKETPLVPGQWFDSPFVNPYRPFDRTTLGQGTLREFIPTQTPRGPRAGALPARRK